MTDGAFLPLAGAGECWGRNCEAASSRGCWVTPCARLFSPLPSSTCWCACHLGLEYRHATLRYAVVIRRNDLVGDGRKVGHTQEVA